MGLQMLGQVDNALRQQGYLHFRAAGIARLDGVFGNKRRATLRGDRHRISPLVRAWPGNGSRIALTQPPLWLQQAFFQAGQTHQAPPHHRSGQAPIGVGLTRYAAHEINQRDMLAE